MMSLPEAIETTKASIASLKAAAQDLKYISALATLFMKKEAVFSNRIENNTMTLHDFLQAVDTTSSPKEAINSIRIHELKDIIQTVKVMEVWYNCEIKFTVY